MLSTYVVSCLRVLAHLLAAATPAASGLASTQHPAQQRPIKARIQLGRCDQQVVYNLPAQRFDKTAYAIAHATGCYIRNPDRSLMNVPVQAVRGRLTRRQALRVALRGTALRIVRETPDLMEVARIPVR
ncbi:hypothetical protein E4631_09125 [Hymenobacter sp. UV11]|uniref:hypothetical protein n=1 Tax=Hymenobacter sp. UV11 TaxID=1849735 RepID=UPI00105EE3B6|nr:hypothetical protein [Hymenobacter sp. UV11]TDN39776.1 hypothetical protein A8B98_17555 [Hymenobacter sp. UV11]TFZ67103.1 hypothetical protein E4631_09125 [Hymenobacter sp. UV11]